LKGPFVTDDEQEKISANPGYAAGQLARALSSTGENAAKQVQQWQQVLAGMIQGILKIGSRTPVAGAPPWVTLEVAHGGFATGSFAAGGVMKVHEIQKIRELQKRGLAPNADINQINENAARTALNIYFADSDGRRELGDMLRSGCFRAHIPEEAALLIATWLMENGETDRVTELLEILGPLFDQLRFYPEPAVQPLRVLSGDVVYMQPASYCTRKLRNKRQQQSVLKMNEAINVWTPLYDRAVNLFLETVEGKIPELVRDEVSTELVRAANGQPIAGGGHPCKRYPADWTARVSTLLKEYEEARTVHGLCKRHEKPKENFAQLRKFLAIAGKDPSQLSARDIGIIRKILASYVTAHGAPGTERLQRTRSMQKESANLPLHSDLANVLADRLDKEPADEGVAELERLKVPLTSDEALKIGAIAGTMFPATLIDKILVCGETPLTSLVEQKLIKSSESMASVLPMLTARTRAARIADPDLSRVFASAYRAFRQRRSLLLLHLESQVRFEELPWIAAVQPWVGSSDDSQASARDALTKAVSLAISAFPYSIVPNKLVKELRSLVKDSGLTVPLVDELAADIFMGSFAVNFLQAAQVAAGLLKGTIYQRYYGIDCDRILALDDIEKKWHTPVSPGFALVCTEMAHAGENTGRRSVAYNGAIIEQAQIVTTHNLAGLWQALDMGNLLRSELCELARDCYIWICRRQQFRLSDWRAELKSIKNCAYAWRQMLFYISLCSEEEQRQFLNWTDEHFSKQPDEFRQRFAPAMQGLKDIMNGDEFDSQGHLTSGGQRFTGWSTKRHFLRRPAEVH